MILLSESSVLEFSVNIQNATSKLDRASLVIECEGYDISLPITLNEDKAVVTLPILENIVPSGKNNIRMEMVIGNSLYVPFKDSMDFYSPPTIKVESFKGTPESASNTGLVFFVESKPVVTLKVNAPDVFVPETTSASKYHEQFFALMEEAEKTLNK